ncbi:PQQ-binding-like beta-propeller repeat protein [bacterium]|nr:PQQ-binding-like beta-propeller repeat protein [bacterium]
MSEPPRLVDGQLLFQQPGQQAVLVQPETGETRQVLPSDHPGWAIPREDKSWIQLGPGGQLLSANNQWTEWRSLGHLRLQRGDDWLGPPVLVGSDLYLATTRGRMQLVELGARWRSSAMGTELPGPLLAPVSHPDGVVEVTVSGLLALRGTNLSWIKPFPGWNQCFSGSGEILARPSVDAEGNIYLATRGQVCSWDRTGKVRWKWRVGCASALVIGDDACYVADTSPSILKLDLASGRVLARSPLPAGVASDPSVEKTLLAVALNNGQVVVRSGWR